MLEQRLRDLEAVVQRHAGEEIPSAAGLATPAPTIPSNTSTEDTRTAQISVESPAPGQSSSSTTAELSFPPSHLGNALGFLSLCAAAEPYYVGSSAGFSLANLVQAAIYDKMDGETSSTSDTPRDSPAGTSPSDSVRPIRNLPSTNDRPFSCHRPRATTSAASLPDNELGEALMQGYFVKIHRFYPFLDRQVVTKNHVERHDLPTDGLSLAQRVILVRLHLIYGLGARHLQLSGQGPTFDKTLPEAHFIAATRHLEQAFELRTTENIEIMLLLAFYSLHSPSGPGVWHLTGMAIRLCVELGLHKRVKGLPDSKRYVDQRRKRIFWSALILERKVAVSLGRPFSIHDWDIDVETSEIHTHIHLARLQPLIACIQTHNSRITEFNPPSLNHLNNTRAALDHWRSAIHPQQLNSHHPEHALLLEYHKALHLLVQPFLAVPQRSSSHISTCATAAGSICQAYKTIHQSESAGFFLLDLHDILVAGVTLIYCLWLNEPSIDSFTLLHDIGACSTVLFLISERWASAKRYRDAFEALVKAAVAYRQRMNQTNSSAAASGQLYLAPQDKALFDAQSVWWGQDEGAAWRRMFEEITGDGVGAAEDPAWWLNDLGLA
ncbi:hypothetical protein CI109_102026 [Kwoniella shandongensis]|uniref:Xylanolytic transcriptional activator regulatory domain-containing protein n=1 Tax=Kwoniella shandongensis TaxID=1734106 RepID=A0AAJ8MU39_9TREE